MLAPARDDDPAPAGRRTALPVAPPDRSGRVAAPGPTPAGTREVAEWKRRGYRRSAKAAFDRWVLASVPADRPDGLPPVVTDRVLLGEKEARAKARRLLAGGTPAVVLPPGHEFATARVPKLIRPPSFACRDPKQWRSSTRQLGRFQAEQGGLEVLAPRRGYGGRGGRSPSAVAGEVDRPIREGRRDFSGALHLNRPSGAIEGQAARRREEVERPRAGALADLLARVDAGRLGPDARAAAIVCTDPREPWLA